MTIVDRIDELEVGTGSAAFWGFGAGGDRDQRTYRRALRGPLSHRLRRSRGKLPRTFPPPLAPDEIANADAVLLTHDHVDHTDPETVLPLAEASPDAYFLASFTGYDTLANAGLDASRLIVPEVGKALSVAGATITAIPSAHTELERDPERGYPYLGYVIEWGGITVYHAGDTVLYDGLIETLFGWRIDVAFVPINGRDYFRTRNGIVGNTDFREAAELAETLDVGVIVPTHYDLLAANAADPGHFVSYLYRLNPMRRHKVLKPGELFYFVQEEAA